MCPYRLTEQFAIQVLLPNMVYLSCPILPTHTYCLPDCLTSTGKEKGERCRLEKWLSMVRNVPRGIGCRVLRSHHCLCIHTHTLALVGGTDMDMEKSDRNKTVTRPAGARCPIVCWNAASSLNGCICILLLGDGCLYQTIIKVCICRCSGHLLCCLHLASTSLPSSPSSCTLSNTSPCCPKVPP